MTLSVIPALVVALTTGATHNLDIATIATITYPAQGQMMVTYNNGTASQLFATDDIATLRFSDAPQVNPPAPTDLSWQTTSANPDKLASKVLLNGKVLIIRGEHLYNLDGKEVTL